MGDFKDALGSLGVKNQRLEELREKMKAGPKPVTFRETFPSHFTEGSRALIRSMLQIDRAKRPTTTEILNNPWFQSVAQPKPKPGRRLATREFSSRRDSPVLVRLLEEIVEANKRSDPEFQL